MEIWSPEAKVLADEVERFCGRWFRNNRGPTLLVVCGQTGSGKSHAMRGALRFCRAAAEPAAALAHWGWPAKLWWADWPPMARAIAENSNSMASVLQDSMEADVLFLDDVGAETDKFKTGEAVDALCQLLSRRDGKWTMITTNIEPMAWASRFDVRVADRLNRGSFIVDLTGAQSYSMRVA